MKGCSREEIERFLKDRVDWVIIDGDKSGVIREIRNEEDLKTLEWVYYYHPLKRAVRYLVHRVLFIHGVLPDMPSFEDDE